MMQANKVLAIILGVVVAPSLLTQAQASHHSTAHRVRQAPPNPSSASITPPKDMQEAFHRCVKILFNIPPANPDTWGAVITQFINELHAIRYLTDSMNCPQESFEIVSAATTLEQELQGYLSHKGIYTPEDFEKIRKRAFYQSVDVVSLIAAGRGYVPE